ncbi:glutathione S-transferase omega-1-like [Oppia nitens]|uniref:glutathione S-transferase omega-1-like n=1 Tax=Oppia nitens TaxID=1686743 RepID=UPI0023DAB056|nr:glutathione S-transferase omega-1-like [Oppia nitens]
MPGILEKLEKNYKKGDPFPDRKNTDLLRIYSYQSCPFAERALLVLAAKDIEHETINVNLKDKPEWLLERNPLGLVPVIEFGDDNKVLYESLIVADYLDEAFPDKRPLQVKDPYIRANDRVFIETFGRNFGILYKVLKEENIDNVWDDIKEAFNKVEQQLAKRKGDNKFLSGTDLPGLTDYMIWPFIERLTLLLDLSGHNTTDYLIKEVPTYHEYRQNLLSDPTVQKVSLSSKLLSNYYILL